MKVFDGPCQNWTGYVDHRGYGTKRVGPKIFRAHRLAWEATYGPIPKGLYVCHPCDNPSCVNPDHLFVGNQQDNMDDMVSKGRSFKGKGERAGNAKLTNRLVSEIKKRLANGETANNIHKDYPVGPSTIYRIRAGTHWNNISTEGVNV